MMTKRGRLPARAPILVVLAWALHLAMPGPAPAATASADDTAVRDNLRHLQSLDQRLADVAWRLASSNLALCPVKQGALGIAVHDAAQYVPAIRAAAIATFGFGDGYPAVLSLAQGSPAQLAGMEPGDRITEIDGTAIAPHAGAAGAASQYDAIEAVMSRLEAVPAGATVEFALMRDDKPLALSVTAQHQCRLRVEMVPGGQINASSDASIVQVQGRLVTWVRSDDELALVVAHEMAHVFLGHHRRLEQQDISTGAFSGLGANGRKLRDLERQADRAGIFMAARAGYDHRGAGAFWRRLSGAKGLGALFAASHPSAGNRGRNADAAVAKVDALLRAARELTP